MREVPEIFARIYARHGHRCPMSTLGGRLGLAALQLLGGSHGVLQAVYGSRTCALDGIVEVTGCSEEAGSLVVRSTGRHALCLQAGERAVTVELSETALRMAGEYRALCDRLERGWDKLEAAEQARRRAEMDAMLDALLPRFWTADDAVLVKTL